MIVSIMVDGSLNKKKHSTKKTNIKFFYFHNKLIVSFAHFETNLKPLYSRKHIQNKDNNDKRYNGHAF